MLEVSDSEKDKELIDSLLEMALEKLKGNEQMTSKLRGELMDKQKKLKEVKEQVSKNMTEKASLDYQVRKCQAELKQIQLRQHSMNGGGGNEMGGSSNGVGGHGSGCLLNGTSQSVPGGLFKQTTKYTIIQPDKGEIWNQPIEPMNIQKSTASTPTLLKHHTGNLVSSKDPKDKALPRWSCCGRDGRAVGCSDDTSAAAKDALVAFPSDTYHPYRNLQESRELSENVQAAHHDSIILPVCMNKGYIGGPVIGLRPQTQTQSQIHQQQQHGQHQRAKSAGGTHRMSSPGGRSPGGGLDGGGSLTAGVSLDGSHFSSGVGGRGHSGHGHSRSGHGDSHRHTASSSAAAVGSSSTSASFPYNPHAHLSHASHAHDHSHKYQELPPHLSQTFIREVGDGCILSHDARPRTANNTPMHSSGLARTSAKARALGVEPEVTMTASGSMTGLGFGFGGYGTSNNDSMSSTLQQNSSAPMRTSELFVQQAVFNNHIDPRHVLDGASQFLLARKSMDATSRAKIGPDGKSRKFRHRTRYLNKEADENEDDEEGDFGHRVSMIHKSKVEYKAVNMYDSSVNTSSIISSDDNPLNSSGMLQRQLQRLSTTGSGGSLMARSIDRLSQPKLSACYVPPDYSTSASSSNSYNNKSTNQQSHHNNNNAGTSGVTTTTVKRPATANALSALRRSATASSNNSSSAGVLDAAVDTTTGSSTTSSNNNSTRRPLSSNRPLTATTGRNVGVLRECTDAKVLITRKQGRPLTAHAGPHLYTTSTIAPGACLTNINARIV